MVIESSKPDTAKSLNGFYVGFFRDNRLASILYFGSGLEYFQNGLKYTGDSKRILHTLSIPLDLKVKLGPVFALGGIAANFKVAEKLVFGEAKYTPGEETKSHWFDAPVFLGAGIIIAFLTVEARYHLGIVDAGNEYFHRYFQLGLGISL